MNNLIDLQPRIVEKMIDDNVVMIDVRRVDEWQRTGVIKNAYLMTFFDEYGQHDVKNWMKEFEKIVTSKEPKFRCSWVNSVKTGKAKSTIQFNCRQKIKEINRGMALWQQELRETIPYN